MNAILMKLGMEFVELKQKDARNSPSRTIKFGKDKRLTLRNSKKHLKTDQFTSQCKLKAVSSNGIHQLTIFTKKILVHHLSEVMPSKLLDGVLMRPEQTMRNSPTLNLTTGLLPTLGAQDGETQDSSEST